MTTHHLRLLRTLAGAAGLALGSVALAHTGVDAAAHHGATFMDGLAHPWGGADHLAAMLAVGVWSALVARRWWMAPAAFAGMLLVGALVGMAGAAIPAVEPMVAASLVVLGLLLALRARLPAPLALAIVGGFAVFHGLAHGAELSGAAQPWLPLAGMLASTVVLHLLGVVLGTALRARSRWWPRIAGTAVALLGGMLLLQLT